MKGVLRASGWKSSTDRYHRNGNRSISACWRTMYIYIYITRVDRELIVFHGPMCTVSRNVESIESQLSFETRSVDRCNLGIYSINGHGDVLIEYSWNEAYDILVGLS